MERRNILFFLPIVMTLSPICNHSLGFEIVIKFKIPEDQKNNNPLQLTRKISTSLRLENCYIKKQIKHRR